MDLFEFVNQSQPLSSPEMTEPSSLAERLRPRQFSDLLGFQTQQVPWLYQQLKEAGEDLQSAKKPVLRRLRSLIVTGPPGCGKTSLVRLIKEHFGGHRVEMLASDFSVKDFRSLQADARDRFILRQEQTLLFLDEVHRLGRVHQDSLLSALERPEIALLGATTENPFSVLSRALLSRCQIVTFKGLSSKDMVELQNRAGQVLSRSPASGLSNESTKNWLPQNLSEALIHRCHGDARVFLSELETLWSLQAQGKSLEQIVPEDLSQLLGEQKVDFDPNGRDHSIAISGLIKTMRSHQVDKAMAWLSVMLAGSVDINFIARRLMIFASEDVGNADPKALPLAVAAAQAVEKIGLPEARILLGHAVSYLATAPKSRSSYEAIHKADDWIAIRSRSQIFQELDPESKAQLPELYEPRSIGYEKNIADFLQKARKPSEPKT